jgi:hypothetical protein
VGFHSLRHSAATIAAKSGVNLALVQKTLGHSTAGMTAGYTHSDRESSLQVLSPLVQAIAPIIDDKSPRSGEAPGGGNEIQVGNSSGSICELAEPALSL